MKAFLRELRRRNVWRAALLYIGATWALAQGISELSSAIGLPEWAPRAFLIASAIGFPFWIAFAWFYELTPDGLKREREVAEGESITRRTGRRLDYWIIGVLSVAVVLLLTDRLLPDAAPAETAAEAAARARSIAVLPMVNASGDAKDDYFADGLSEELMSRLARIPDLRVIARNSAFEFKDSKAPRQQIADRLGVAHLLEGTVRRHGDQLRILVELVRPGDDTSLWSQTYNRDLKDIFAVQADIAQEVARALEVELGDKAKVDYEQPPGGNLAAYEALLQARARRRLGTTGDSEAAADLFREAIRLEPAYAMAHYEHAAGLATMIANGIGNADLLRAELRTAAETAMTLAPEFHGSHLAQGLLHYINGDQPAAEAAYRRALALAPQDGRVARVLAYSLIDSGKYDEAIRLTTQAVASDPLALGWRSTLALAQQFAGQREAAAETLRAALAIQPDHPELLGSMSRLLLQLGRFEEAEDYARRGIAADPDRLLYRHDLAMAIRGSRGLEAAWPVLEEALAMQPDYARTRWMMAMLLAQHGRHGEVIEHARRAISADPRSSTGYLLLGSALAASGRLEEAERELRMALARSPDEIGLNAVLTEIVVRRGDTTAARAAAEAETDPDNRRYALALVAALEGDPERLDAAVRILLDSCASTAGMCQGMASAVYAFARQPDRMFAALDEAERDPGYLPSLMDGFFAPYYDDPRFIAHLAKYHMTPPSPVSKPAPAH